MVLTDSHLQVLKHINGYSNIKRYHGLLPKKEAAIYDDDLIKYLIDLGLIEEGVIFTSCGNSRVGYKISSKAASEFNKYGIDIKNSDWDKLCEVDFEIDDCLDKEHIKALMDIYHFSRINLYCGIAPRRMMEQSYNHEVFCVLEDIGFVNRISLKGPSVSYRNGYVLSSKASRMLQQIGYVR
jgi:hypothetical protein